MNLKQFKQFMKESIGKNFSCKQYIFKEGKPVLLWDAGIRELNFVDTVKFGFKTGKGTSYCDFPKASEFMIINNRLAGDTKDNLSYRINSDFDEDKRYLIYKLEE